MHKIKTSFHYHLFIGSNDLNVSKDVWLKQICRVCNRNIKRFALFAYVFFSLLRTSVSIVSSWLAHTLFMFTSRCRAIRWLNLYIGKDCLNVYIGIQ